MNNHAIVINVRQYAWLIGSLITGGGMIGVQHELFRIARTDAWFTYLIPLAYLLLVAFVFYQMARRFPEKNMFEIILIVFGRFAGTVINLLLIFHLWLILMRDLRSFGKFINTILLPNTPEEMLVLLFMLILVFYGRTSVEVVARVNDIFFPVFFLIILPLPLVLSNELDIRFIQPVLTVDAQRYSFASMVGIGWYGDIFFAGAFLHTLRSAKQAQAAIRHGSIMGIFLMSLLAFVEVLVHGPYVPGNMVYPIYSLVQQIHVTDFLDRVDLFILSIWFPIIACKVILIYLAFLIGIASLIKKRDYTVINAPVSLFLLLTTILAFKSTTEVFSFGNYSSPVIVLGYQPLLFLLLLLLLRRHPVRLEERQQKAPSADATGSQGSKGKQKMKTNANKVRYGSWILYSNLMIGLCIGFIITGIAWSRSFSIVGVLCAWGFALCLTCSVFTSYMEVRKSKRMNIEPTAAAS